MSEFEFLNVPKNSQNQFLFSKPFIANFSKLLSKLTESEIND